MGHPATSYELFEAIKQRAPAVSFDLECIEDEGAYANLLAEFVEAAQLPVTSLSSVNDYDGPTTVTYTFEGVVRSAEWHQGGCDFVDGHFFALVDTLCDAHGRGRFVAFPSEDQCYEGAYLPLTIASEVDRCFRAIEATWFGDEDEADEDGEDGDSSCDGMPKS